MTDTQRKLECLQLAIDRGNVRDRNKVHNPKSGDIELVYTEAVTFEFLCNASATVEGLSGEPAQPLNQREIHCLHVARDLLEKPLRPAPTVRRVDRTAGFNETTLKRGFKAVFGETLIEFSVRCRMQRALRLLTMKSVKQVAAAIGYSHETSFATAFRRQLGLRRPRDASK